MTRYTLGLDLGTNSVGWAMIAQDADTFEDGRRIVAGVRVFPEGVADMNQKKEHARGQERRERRSQRRVLYRRRQRRCQLKAILVHAGLMPADPDERRALLARNPYLLRAQGLDQRLEPHLFGRALYHLCQRRGFKSNRKSESKDDNKITKDAGALQAEVEQAGCRTLGEYRARKWTHTDHRAGEAQRLRGRYTLRVMYEHEFQLLWEGQAQHHGPVLTDDLRERVHKAIFDQRPLRFDPDVIGGCELEKGQKRCARAHWLAERFRMLQEINHLRVVRASGATTALSPEERAKLADALGGKTKMTFKAMRKRLGLLPTETFNLETEGKRDYLLGNRVEAALRHRTLRKWYEPLPETTRRQVHDALAETQDPEDLRALALGAWACTDEQTVQLLKTSLPGGHLRVSAKAIEKMLPYLEPDHVCGNRCRELFPEKDPDAGHVVSEAKALAGYELEPPVPEFDRLPALSAKEVQDTVGRVTNPLVRRALGETRKVVNALVREYGKPEEIVVELARDMKHTKDQRRDIHFDNIRRWNENDVIGQRLQAEFNIPSPSRTDIIKYRLWTECGKVCVYTGKPIPKTKLFSPEIQIEHIYPLDRSLDDSWWNKTLCYGHEVNAHKGSRTPYEAYHDTPEYDEILQRVQKHLPWKKRRRFTVKEVEFDEFASRQLNDTRYASRLAVRYLRCLGVEVRPVKGQTTSKLGHYWGLYGVLGTDYSKARDDHRYHAIDAVVIALTTRSHLQRLSTVLGGSPRQTPLDPPWEGFWNEVRDTIDAVTVSHRPMRKLAGKLHEETGYGPTAEPETYVYRVPVQRLTPTMVARIRDKTIRAIVEARLAERGVELKASKALGNVLTEPPLRMASDVPIRRVRILTAATTAKPIRRVAGKAAKFVLPGGNHHVEVYEKADGTWTGECVSRFEACERLRRGEPVVCREPGDGATFKMSLCINDMVQLTDPETGEVCLYRVQKTSSAHHMVVLRLHTAARIDEKETAAPSDSVNVLRQWNMQKVNVDPLGRISPCHD